MPGPPTNCNLPLFDIPIPAIPSLIPLPPFPLPDLPEIPPIPEVSCPID